MVMRSSWEASSTGSGVFAVLWFGIVPLVDPVFLKINARVFVVAHIAWGATLAIMPTRHHLSRLLSEHARALRVYATHHVNPHRMLITLRALDDLLFAYPMADQLGRARALVLER
jgi:hypothetical protein